MSDALRIERNGYRVELDASGLRVAAIGRSYDQRDEREYEKCLWVPWDEIVGLGEAIQEMHDKGVALGLWSAGEAA